jgi:hypothetical protein
MPWTFKDRQDDQGGNVIRRWQDAEVPLKARLKFDQILRNLAISDQLYPHIKKIKGHAGVFELVLRHDKVQYRPLGGHGPNRAEFTFVLGAIEHNDKIRPRDAFETASRHIATLSAGTLRICDHEYEKPSPEDCQQLAR